MTRLLSTATLVVTVSTLAVGCRQEIALPEVSVDARVAVDGPRGQVVVPQDADPPGPDLAPPRDVSPRPDTPPPDASEHCEYVSKQDAYFQHPKVIIALDRSASMQERPAAGGMSRLHGVQSVLEPLIKRYQLALHFGYVEFPITDCFEGRCCASRAVTPARETLASIKRRWSCELGPASCGSTTKDSPVSEALYSSWQGFDRSDNGVDSRHVLLLTDGEPTCAVNPTSDACMRAGQEAARLSGVEVSTTVFGLTEALRTSRCLADLATLGGSGSPQIAATDEELRKALEDKLGTLSAEACIMRVDFALGTGQRLRIYLNQIEVERDPSRKHGWEIDPGVPTKVTFYGDWCEKLRTSLVPVYRVETCR